MMTPNERVEGRPQGVRSHDELGGDERKMMDILEEMRWFEIDHEPDGWPAVRMRQITALCDEVERLRKIATGEIFVVVADAPKPPAPGEMTAHQLLLALVPDFDRRLDNAAPDLRARILELAQSEDGWRPLHYLQGCL